MAKKRKLAGGGPKRKSRKRPVGKRARATRAAIGRAKGARRRRNASTKSNTRTATRTATEVRSPTSTATSTKARTVGNVTVTGGAGRGATTTVILRKNPKRRRRNSSGISSARANPARRRNQEDTGLRSAEKMFRNFHGKKAGRVDIVEQLRVTPDALADCGRLVELVVDTGRGGRRLPWPDKNAPRVATTGDGGQLYFLKGDQSPDLAGFPGIRLPKDHLDLGELVSIVYFTSKDFHNFEPSEYEHHFGLNDDTGAPRGTRPTLHYDVHSKRLYLTGGTYRVKRAGIVG